ncbi:hypothetical protein CEY00_Acc03556 [Actinidia chinensis var. chinensis]|uniref:Pectinesterase inhibitor domain-containing protein n=1 Tax=Actinidia chinensis var. chinensis TaxID=1590841 RepID=A0A2R6RT00_ACTCC|nr:hypothetical protein CEY00_Acc03556 [Actinidia chinensis var. chinensis]
MSRPTLPLLPLILSLLFIARGTAEPNDGQNFVMALCRETPFPTVCYMSLGVHAEAIRQDPHELARTALTLSVAGAEATKADMLKLAHITGLKPAEYGALKDCLDQIEDSVNRLTQSAREIEQLGQAKGDEFSWHVSNVVTWTSAALAQMDTCGRGFSDRALDGKIKASVQPEVIHVWQLIRNALELFQQFAAQKVIIENI